MIKRNHFFLILFWLMAFAAISACTSDQNVEVIRKAIKLEVETNHQNEEQASLPDPEKNMLPESFVTKSYYDAGNLLLKEEKWLADGKLEWKKELVYDGAGNNLERWTFHRDSVVERIVQKFNAANRLIREEEYGPDEKLFRKKSAAYDRDGNGVITTFTNIKNEFIKSMESFYDSSGRLMEDRYFVEQTGDESHSSLPKMNLWLRRVTFLYDAKNNVSQTMEVNSNLVMKSNTSYAYDSLNNTIALIIQSAEKSRAQHFRYEYQYDSSGQWKKKKIFLNNHLISVTNRQIISPVPENK